MENVGDFGSGENVARQKTTGVKRVSRKTDLAAGPARPGLLGWIRTRFAKDTMLVKPVEQFTPKLSIADGGAFVRGSEEAGVRNRQQREEKRVDKAIRAEIDVIAPPDLTAWETLKAGKWEMATVGLGFAGRALAMKLGIPPETIGSVIKMAVMSSSLLAAASRDLVMHQQKQLDVIPLSETVERAKLEGRQRVLKAIGGFSQKVTFASIGAGIGEITQPHIGHFFDNLGNSIHNALPEQPIHTVDVPQVNLNDPAGGHREAGAGYNDTPVSPSSAAHPPENPIAIPGQAGIDPGPAQPAPHIETLATQVGQTQYEHSLAHAVSNPPLASPPGTLPDEAPAIHVKEFHDTQDGDPTK